MMHGLTNSKLKKKYNYVAKYENSRCRATGTTTVEQPVQL